MDPFLGEIRIFAGNFAPRGWALCNGQLIAISQNTALFALFGTTYGGDGRSTFGLPDLQGRAPMHWGSGTGLTQRYLGEKDGEANVTLNSSQLPSHTHPLHAFTTRASADSSSPSGGAFAKTSETYYVNPPSSLVQMSGSTVGPNGGGQAHYNMQPFLALSFIVALQGIFPQRP